MNMKTKLLTALLGGTLIAGNLMAQTITYTQPFNNTTNQVLIPNATPNALTNWGWAAVNGNAPNIPGTQWGTLSDANGAGGTPGLAYNLGANNVRGFATWFAGDLETPANAMSLAQSDLLSLSTRIGHGHTANQTRWLMRIDDDGTDRWFVSLQTYQMATAIEFVSGFEDNNIGISANFTDLEWRPLLNPDEDAPFDGLIGAASDGFTLITNAANPAASTLPTGNITALGVYHWHTNNSATRFDDFTIVAIPEPGTLVLFGIAVGSVFLFRRRKK